MQYFRHSRAYVQNLKYKSGWDFPLMVRLDKERGAYNYSIYVYHQLVDNEPDNLGRVLKSSC